MLNIFNILEFFLLKNVISIEYKKYKIICSIKFSSNNIKIYVFFEGKDFG